MPLTIRSPWCPRERSLMKRRKAALGILCILLFSVAAAAEDRQTELEEMCVQIEQWKELIEEWDDSEESYYIQECYNQLLNYFDLVANRLRAIQSLIEYGDPPE